MQLSTVLSDSFVALTAIFALTKIFEKKYEVHILIKITSFLLMILAACTGILRFSLFPGLSILHETLSAIASHVGMLFLLVLFYSYFIKPFQYGPYLLIGLGILSALSFYFEYSVLYTKITGAIAVLGIIVVCISKFKEKRQAAILGIVACMFSMIAGSFQEFKITLGPLLDIDLFHYALSIANILWGISINRIVHR